MWGRAIKKNQLYLYIFSKTPPKFRKSENLFLQILNCISSRWLLHCWRKRMAVNLSMVQVPKGCWCCQTDSRKRQEQIKRAGAKRCGVEERLVKIYRTGFVKMFCLFRSRPNAVHCCCTQYCLASPSSQSLFSSALSKSLSLFWYLTKMFLFWSADLAKRSAPDQSCCCVYHYNPDLIMGSE